MVPWGVGKDVRPEGGAGQPPACRDLVTVTSKEKLHSPRPLPSSARRLQSRGARLHPARRGSVQATNTRSGRQTQAPQRELSAPPRRAERARRRHKLLSRPGGPVAAGEEEPAPRPQDS